MTVQQQGQPAATEREDRVDPTAPPTAQEKAQEKERENETAAEEMRELEGGEAPTDLDDWPSGPAKYLTYGNNDNEVYGVGVTAKLGPANLERFDDGSISIDGKKVDNPDDYKGEPIAGGPTDTEAPS
jgi:hypothetical protein